MKYYELRYSRALLSAASPENPWVYRARDYYVKKDFAHPVYTLSLDTQKM